MKVSEGAKIKNRHNQVPLMTKDTNGKVTNAQLDTTTRAKRSALSQQVTTRHTQDRKKLIKDPQRKYRLGSVNKIFY